jgi:hypothetical protein
MENEFLAPPSTFPIASQSEPPSPATELSIVMPCFNEADNIEQRVRDWTAAAHAATPHFEMVIINDGSSDGSGRILDRLRKELKSIRLIHQLNGGHARAVRRGYELARGRFVLQVDSNGSYRPAEFAAFWAKRNSFELVVGTRGPWIRGRMRRLLVGVLRWWIGFLFGNTLEDPDVPFRLFRRETVLGYLNGIPKDFEGVNLALTLLIQRDFPHGVAELRLGPPAPAPVKSRPPLLAFTSLIVHFFLEVTQLRFSNRFAPPLMGPLVGNPSN